MFEQTIAQIKNILRPIAMKRVLLEKRKYRGQTILSPQEGNDLLAAAVHKPGAAGKIGDSELRGLRNYLRRTGGSGECDNWGASAKFLHRNAGVYPSDPAIFSRFCGEFLQALTQLDILAVWFRPGEANVQHKYAKQARLVSLTALEPYYHERPWTAQLAGKRVVVVSPFTSTIKATFERRREVWAKKPDVLPDFQLRTIRCPLSAGVADPEYADWFTALDAMRQEMSSAPFDVAIIGAGAWSIPLAAHAKSVGAFGIHLGGGTQLLFGVKGGRWDGDSPVSVYFNDAWTRPGADEKPKSFRSVENGCYW
jgi:hypothetical protein